MNTFSKILGALNKALSSRWFVSIISFVIFLALFQMSIVLVKQKHAADYEKSMILYSNDVAAHLEREVNKLIYLANGVNAYIQLHNDKIDDSELNSMLREIHNNEPDLIRNIGVAQGYVIKWMHPVQGNEKAIGMDYREQAEQLPKVQAAINSKRGAIDGPLTLVQGGKAMIYRTPVYINKQYWGLISTVINVDKLYEFAFSKIDHNDYEFAVSNAKDADKENIIYGALEVFKSDDAIIVEKAVPNNFWYYAVAPKQGKQEIKYLKVINWGGLFVALLVFILVFYVWTLRNKSVENLKNYKFLSENASDMVWLYDIKSRELIYVSPSVKQLTGYLPQEYVKSAVNDILDSNSISKIIQSFPKRLKEYLKNPLHGQYYTDQLQHKTKDGSTIWLETITLFKRDETGNIQVIGVSRNIDDRKKAEMALAESETKFRAIFNSASDGYLLVEKEGCKITMGNETMFKMLRYEEEELIGDTVQRIHPENFEICYQAMTSDSIFKKTTHEYFEITRKDGTRFYADIKPSQVKIAAQDFIFCAFRDVTEKLQMEKELRALNDEKDRFISILAHDLRSPFNGLLGFMDVILEELDTLPPDELRSMLSQVHETSRSIYELLEELLLWSKSQSDSVEVNPTMVNFKVLNSAIEKLYKKQVVDKNLQLKFSFNYEMNVFADESYMKIIMRNLVSNAIKFTEKGGEVEIKASEIAKEYRIEVQDSGVGMDEKTLNNLWIYTSNKSKRGTENEKGSGFGLMLCKELIEKHGGKIWAESKPGEGSVFIFILPK